jgi:signal peptide peptidase SppA
MANSNGSIFSTAIRAFCKMFFGIIGIFLAFVFCSLIYSMFSSSPLLEEKTVMTLVPDANDKVELCSVSSPVILEIPINGVIGDPQKLTAETIRNILVDSQMGLLRDHRIKGILLNFNTPGGTVVDSDAIYRMLLDYKARYKVPIYGYVDGLCASGGMMIASAADQMFSGPAGVIGSVGVVWGPFFNFYDLMTTYGVHAKTFTEGLDKDFLNPTRPWTDRDSTSISAIMEFQYNQFVDIVTSARPRLDRTKLVQEYGAHVFDCVSAAENGYIDHPMSSRKEALLALLQTAGIDANQPYQVINLVSKNAWIADLMKGQSPLISGKIEHVFGDISMRILEQPCYLYQHE